MKEAKLTLTIILLLVILGVFSWAFLVPKVNQVLETREKINQDQARLVKLKSKLQDLEGLNEYELSEKTKTTIKAIPTEKNFDEVLGIVEKTAGENNLTVKTVQFILGGLKPKETKEEIPYKITLNGDTESVRNFLIALEKFLPLMDVTGKIQTNLSSGGTDTLWIIQNNVMALPALGKIESPLPRLTTDEEKSLTLIGGYTTSPPIDIIPPSGRADPFNF